MFAVIGYSLFPDQYPNFTCDSLIHCFLFEIDATFQKQWRYGQLWQEYIL